MPVYNRAGVVRRAVDSVLAQDFADFELIVVDDGSTDGTRSQVEEIDDRRVRLLALDVNGGSNAARNRGIEAAAAPLICFLDSDDAYLPHKLSTVARIFAEQPNLDVLLDSFRKHYPPGHSRSEARRTNPVIDGSEEFAAALFARKLWKATSAISVRKEAALRAGLFDEGLKRRQDLDFLIRLARVARCASTDQVLWVKTWTPGAISDEPDKFIAATLELHRRYPEYLSDRRLRPGLARDITRHLGRRVGAGRVAAAAREARQLGQELGAPMLGRLIVEGAVELLRRHLKRVRKR